jgi:hypothetical protein
LAGLDEEGKEGKAAGRGGNHGGAEPGKAEEGKKKKGRGRGAADRWGRRVSGRRKRKRKRWRGPLRGRGIAGCWACWAER